MTAVQGTYSSQERTVSFETLASLPCIPVVRSASAMMSAASQKALQAFVIQTLNVEHSTYICNAMATMLAYYEFAITFSDEIRFIWCRRFTLATALFCINRYTMLLARTLLIVQLLPYQYEEPTLGSGDMLCSGLLRSSEVLTIMSQISVAVFLALRMFAMWDRDYKIFTIVLVIGMIAPVSSIYYYTRLSPTIVPLPYTGCAELAKISDNALQTCSLGIRLSAIVSEVIILVLTWKKTVGTIRLSGKLESPPSIVKLVFRDGTIYFVSLLILNVANILATQYKLFGSTPLPAFNDVITSITISRFLLNLREVYDAPFDKYDSSESFAASSGVQFANIPVGNIGAPLYSMFEPALDDSLESKDADEGLEIFRESWIGRLPSAPTSPTMVDETIVIYDGDENGMYFVVDLKEIC